MGSSEVSRSINATTMHDEPLLRKLLSCERHHDVHLKGSDGVLVGANRCVLATSSAVFDKVLYKSVKSSTDQVELPYKGAVLQALVEYIYTEESDLVNSILCANAVDLGSQIASLVEASMYFDLSSVANHVVAITVEEKPSLAVDLILAINDMACRFCHDLVIAPAREKIRSQPRVLRDHGLIGRLKPSIIEELLRYQDLRCNEFLLFQILREWAKGSESNMSKAMELSKLVALEFLSPCQLETVASSGLVCNTQLETALKAHSLRFFFNYTRDDGNATWVVNKSYTGSTTFCTNEAKGDAKLNAFLCGGIHRWTIHVHGNLNGVRYGIVAMEHRIVARQHKADADRCVPVKSLTKAGKKKEAGEEEEETGDKVQFVLDLTGTGWLKAYVNDESPDVLFNDILSLPELQGIENVIFAPYVQSNNGSKITFLGFE